VNAWMVVIAVGLGTYAFRAFAFVVIGDGGLPTWMQRPLTFVGPAALGALVGGMLLTGHGHAEVPALAEVGAVLAAFVTVRRTGNVGRGILIGFPVLWALTWLTG
jgi:branched-subunit amino acid transport protein